MATQKDVNDMLNLNQGQQQQKGGNLTKILKKDRNDESMIFVKKRHRPKGCIAREIEQLKQSSIHIANESQPSLVPDYSVNAGEEDGGEDGFKKKRSLVPVRGGGDDSGEGSGTKWVWKGFTNPARGEHDKTVFYHWVPSTDVNDEYEFARFNKRAPVITYTKEEYRNQLTGPEASDYGKNVFTNEDEDDDFEYYDVTNDENDTEDESDDDDDTDDTKSDDESDKASDSKEGKSVGDDNEDEDIFVKGSRKRKRPKKERKSITARFSDTNWTEKETDKLFELCERFDLRWVVITDRWNTDVLAENGCDDSDGESSAKGDLQGPKLYNYRTMEELKGRYYHVASKIAAAHKLPKSNPYISYKFNIKNEVRRKALLNRLHRRTAEEVKEEEELLEILQRIDQQLHKGNKTQEQTVLVKKSIGNTGGNDGQENDDGDDDEDYGETEIDYEGSEPILKRLKVKKIIGVKPFMRSQIQYLSKASKDVENELEITYGSKTVMIPTERSVSKYIELRSAVQKRQELERLIKQKELLISLLKPNYARLAAELEVLQKRAEDSKKRKSEVPAEAEPTQKPPQPDASNPAKEVPVKTESIDKEHQS